MKCVSILTISFTGDESDMVQWVEHSQRGDCYLGVSKTYNRIKQNSWYVFMFTSRICSVHVTVLIV